MHATTYLIITDIAVDKRNLFKGMHAQTDSSQVYLFDKKNKYYALYTES